MYSNGVKSCLAARTTVALSCGMADCDVSLLHTPLQKQDKMQKYVNCSTGAVECKVEGVASSALFVCFCVVCVELRLYREVCVGLYCDCNKVCVYI